MKATVNSFRRITTEIEGGLPAMEVSGSHGIIWYKSQRYLSTL